MSRPFVSQSSFSFQVWQDLEWNQDSADPPRELFRPLTPSWFLLGRLYLLSLPLLLGTCLPSLWSPPFPPHSPAPIPLLFAKVRLSLTLTLSQLTILWSRQIALFLFLFAKPALASLPTAYFMAMTSPFPFRQPQYVQDFPLNLAPFCNLSPDPGSTNKSTISLLFSFSRFVLFFVFPLTSISLADLAGTVFSFLYYQIAMGPRTLVSPGRRDWCAGQTGAQLVLCAIPCSLSPLISRIHSSLFSDWRRIVTSKFFDTLVFLISTEKLVLPRHARCALSRLRCNGHSLLLSSISIGLAESRVLRAAPTALGRISVPDKCSCTMLAWVLRCPALGKIALR